MQFIHTIAPSELDMLEKLLRSHNTIIHRRARIVILSTQGKKVDEIAQAVGVCQATVRPVISSFNRIGVDSIYPKKKSGRPRKLDASIEDKIIELVRRKPSEYGIESGVWTLEEACKAAIKDEIVPYIGKTSLARVLGRNGLSWKRVKGWIAPSDPEYEIKKKRRDLAIGTALDCDDYDLEFADETWFVAQEPDGIMNHHTGSVWSDIGKPTVVPSSRKKSKITLSVYAGLSLKSGQINYRFTHKNNTDETIEYLKMRSEQCMLQGLKRLYIVWDNASFHISKALKSWLKEHNRNARRCGITQIHFVCLPSKSPWLNPIEAVFRWIKRRVLLCRIHESLEVLRQMVAAVIGQRNELQALARQE